LFLGTAADNTQDMMSKGRDRRGNPVLKRGEDRRGSKLTEAAVLDIRQRAGHVTQDQLAAEYGVRQMTISDAVRRKTWTHI
jgi:hypothetical protein